VGHLPRNRNGDTTTHLQRTNQRKTLSTTLKELTWENHKKAERTRFISRFIKRQVTPYQYYIYLSNQLLCYYALEEAAFNLGLFKEIESIKRYVAISKDLAELEAEHRFQIPKTLVSTQRYVDYIQSISDVPEKLMAHIYVRHMGDLSGGQILKRLAPGKGLYYHFDQDVTLLKEEVRKRLDDSMAPEANRCFEMVCDFFEELEDFFDDLGPTNQTSK
jgi:heme oxygenase (biliverdin-producing, ferredoxin)